MRDEHIFTYVLENKLRELMPKINMLEGEPEEPLLHF